MTLSTCVVPTPAPTTPAPRTPALPLDELLKTVRDWTDHPERWRPVLRMPSPGEDRWWTRLHADDRLDIWLLSWRPGHSTELHDHGRSEAAFSVVSGELTELRGTPGAREITAWHHLAPTATTVPVGVVHDVIAAVSDAVSIHAYSPPLEQMTYYRRDERGVLRHLESITTDDPERGPSPSLQEQR